PDGGGHRLPPLRPPSEGQPERLLFLRTALPIRNRINAKGPVLAGPHIFAHWGQTVDRTTTSEVAHHERQASGPADRGPVPSPLRPLLLQHRWEVRGPGPSGGLF